MPRARRVRGAFAACVLGAVVSVLAGAAPSQDHGLAGSPRADGSTSAPSTLTWG